MQKILVPTDFSTASRAGMRFAVQLATQLGLEPVFYHHFEPLVLTTIHREQVDRTVEAQRIDHLERLQEFVAEVHHAMHVTPGRFECVVEPGTNASQAIVDYAKQHGAAFICMSTRGAGTLRKLVGTHTGAVITRSTVPVVAVPENYHTHAVRRLLYASDMDNPERELAAVLRLADTLEAGVDLVHIQAMGQSTADWMPRITEWKARYPRFEHAIFEPVDLSVNFEQRLSAVVARRHPDLVVLFTSAGRTWFDRLFGDSHAESLSFVTKTPMLVFRKATVDSGMVVL